MIGDLQRACERRHERLSREAYGLERECGGPIMMSAWLYLGAAWARLGAEALRPFAR